MGYVNTEMSDHFHALFVSLMALRLALVAAEISFGLIRYIMSFRSFPNLYRQLRIIS